MKQVYKFSATWCTPCKVLTNMLAKEGITLPEYDVGNPDVKGLMNKYNIKSVPTVIIDEDGVVTTFTGLGSFPKLLAAVK